MIFGMDTTAPLQKITPLIVKLQMQKKKKTQKSFKSVSQNISDRKKRNILQCKLFSRYRAAPNSHKYKKIFNIRSKKKIISSKLS